MRDNTIRFKTFKTDQVDVGGCLNGIVQVGRDLLVLDGPEKKCSLLTNLFTNRFCILEKSVPPHIQKSQGFNFKGYSVCSYDNQYVFVSGGDDTHHGLEGEYPEGK